MTILYKRQHHQRQTHLNQWMTTTRIPNIQTRVRIIHLLSILFRFLNIFFPYFKVVNQESDKQYVRLTMKIPGLKTKRQFNFQKAPINGRLALAEYQKK